eukprot:scaffold11225_cov277-Chaetoceros_neogracile.AAC.1
MDEKLSLADYAAHLIIKGLAQEIDDDNITSKGTKEANGSANLPSNHSSRGGVRGVHQDSGEKSQCYEVQPATILNLGCGARFIKYDSEDAQHYPGQQPPDCNI